MSVPENKKHAQEILERSQHDFYRYEPYFNRTDGLPSWQWKFLAAAGDYKGRVAVGANQIGKTKEGAFECILAITGTHPFREFPKNQHGWVIGLDNKMIARVDLPDFDAFLPPHYRTHFDKQSNIWYCDNEGDGRHAKIEFLSTEMGVDKFQGAKIDWIWFDEEPKKTNIFTECMMRLVAKRGVWWMTATPIRGTAWLAALIEREDVFDISAGIIDNPYIPEEEIERLKSEYTEDEIATRIYGKYITFGGNPVFNIRSLNKMLADIKHDIPALVGTLRETEAA